MTMLLKSHDHSARPPLSLGGLSFDSLFEPLQFGAFLTKNLVKAVARVSQYSDRYQNAEGTESRRVLGR
jgi:hypothetical protein